MHEIKDPDIKELREFGFVTGGIVAGLFGLLLPWLLEASYPVWPWVVGGVLALWGLAAPGTLKPVYRGWMKFGLFMGKIMTPLILGIVFFLMFMPVGLVMRMFGRDPMARRMDSASESFRVSSSEAQKQSMERPF